MTYEKKRWLIQAPIGLSLFGFGLCLFSEAGHIKHSGGELGDWFALGTLSLIVVNSGLSLVVDAGLWKLKGKL
jgi:hypothetical protein